MIKSPFNIINASAGSGKTYSLVFNYLCRLLLNPNDDNYRNLLALTFTNKAVNEMKNRIIMNLADFSIENDSIMKTEISKAIGVSVRDIQIKSKRILQKILHDYGGFDILTLDSFTYRIIRTFAIDLNIPKSFEVVIRQDEVLEDLIQTIIDKAGDNNQINDVLVDFVHYKINNDVKVSLDKALLETAKLLLNENDRDYIKKLKKFSLSDFKNEYKSLNNKQEQYSNKAIKTAKNILDKILSNGLDKSMFYHGMVINHFNKIAKGEFKNLYAGKLEEYLNSEKNILNKSTPSDLKIIVEKMIPDIYRHFLSAKKDVSLYNLIDDLKKSWIPISLLTNLEQSLEFYQKDQKKMLLAQFNERISKIIDNDEVPFIYEKLGQKYRHFFVDEFQDTSKLQWDNLKPLLRHALEGEDLSGNSGSVFLVGDPKQAIYRWRGGDVRLFLDILNDKRLNQTSAKIKNLPFNRRSLNNIVEFNNSFFKNASRSISKLEYQSFYEISSKQNTKNKPGGSVEIHFIEKNHNNKKELQIDLSQLYINKIIEIILKVKEDGFSWSSIAILVRLKDDGVSVFEAISKTKIPVISSESLLVRNSNEVNLIISVLILQIQPENIEERIKISSYFIEKLNLIKKAHEILNKTVEGTLVDFYNFIKKSFGYSIETKLLSELSFYESIENIIKSFELSNNFDAYIEFFLDYCYSFSNQSENTIYDFLRKWKIDSEHASIQLPDDNNAVRIMTIHKAKGLEFPVVILPFLDSDFQPNIPRRQIWYPIEISDSKIPYGRINFSSKRLKNDYGNLGKNILENDIIQNELDSLNVLYVAMTRASSKMVIMTTYIEKEKLDKQKKSYAKLFNEFVRINHSSIIISNKHHYVFGDKISFPKELTEENIKYDSIIPEFNFIWKEKIKLDTELFSDTQRLKGIIIHRLLSKIKFDSDINFAIDSGVVEGILTNHETKIYKKLLKKVVAHKDLKHLFSLGNIIYTEKDILLPSNQIIRPDRIVISNKKCHVIDYKTGNPNDQDWGQVNMYSKFLKLITKLETESYLVYIKDDVIVKKKINI
tara:strand:- start:1162 stop:4320 length:3159 start_codon:yes stop_codon:yes gene_type:complete